MMHVGSGCTVQQTGLPVHNPEPSTKRGQRRHTKRSEAFQQRAIKAWAKQRSRFPRCRPKNAPQGQHTKDAYISKAA